MTLVDPDGVELLRVEGQVEAGRPPGMNPGSSQRIPVAFSLGHDFSKAGPYAVFARVDHEQSNNLDRNRKITFQVNAPPAFLFPPQPANQTPAI